MNQIFQHLRSLCAFSLLLVTASAGIAQPVRQVQKQAALTIPGIRLNSDVKELGVKRSILDDQSFAVDNGIIYHTENTICYKSLQNQACDNFIWLSNEQEVFIPGKIKEETRNMAQINILYWGIEPAPVHKNHRALIPATAFKDDTMVSVGGLFRELLAQRPDSLLNISPEIDTLTLLYVPLDDASNPSLKKRLSDELNIQSSMVYILWNRKAQKSPPDFLAAPGSQYKTEKMAVRWLNAGSIFVDGKNIQSIGYRLKGNSAISELKMMTPGPIKCRDIPDKYTKVEFYKPYGLNIVQSDNADTTNQLTDSLSVNIDNNNLVALKSVPLACDVIYIDASQFEWRSLIARKLDSITKGSTLFFCYLGLDNNSPITAKNTGSLASLKSDLVFRNFDEPYIMNDMEILFKKFGYERIAGRMPVTFHLFLTGSSYKNNIEEVVYRIQRIRRETSKDRLRITVYQENAPRKLIWSSEIYK